MHEIQRKILNLTSLFNLGRMTLREIGLEIDEPSPQKVKHHLHQLAIKGHIRIDKENRLVQKIDAGSTSGLLTNAKLLRIPVFGAANAGPATFFAEQNAEDYLTVSSTFVGSKANRKLFAIKVDGHSMNRAMVDGKKIEDGDIVIVDSENQSPNNGDIVLSVIGGLANIKRLRYDTEHDQILLMSESTSDFAPIYIHGSDEFLVNGVVIQVVKRPR